MRPTEADTSTAFTLTVLGAAAGVLFALLFGVFFAQLSGPDASTAVLAWWAALCAVSVFNLGAWVLIKPGSEPDMVEFRRKQRWLSLAFVLVCAFRSFLPRASVQRICMVDSWLSTVVVGRSLATVAEMCFMAQWALILRELADHVGSSVARTISRLIVPLIAIAEICSWYSVITTSYIGNAIEESIWALSAMLLMTGAVVLWPQLDARYKRLAALTLAFGAAYVAFMCTVDVPMYVSRWRTDEAIGRPYLSLGAGLSEITYRRIVTYSWQDWSGELAWMGLYFSVVVWSSIALIHLPRWRTSKP